MKIFRKLNLLSAFGSMAMAIAFATPAFTGKSIFYEMDIFSSNMLGAIFFIVSVLLFFLYFRSIAPEKSA